MGVSVPSKSIFESLSAAERRRKRLGVSLEYLESIAFVPARAALRVRAIDVTDQAAASSCVVIAPHPDDETLGCGAIIARKRAAGTNVRVVIVTDGRRSHRSDKIPVHRLIALRRKEAQEKSVDAWENERVKVDFVGQTLLVSGSAVEVSTREFRLLRYLIENRGRVLSRDQILNKVWGFDYEGTARTIDNFINKLRAKMEVDPAEPELIVTVRGVGYKFAG